MAAQTRTRRGSKSSWLLIDPLFQSWPTKVVPSSSISMVSTIATPIPEPCRSVSRSSAGRLTNQSTWGSIMSSHAALTSALPPTP